MVVSDGLGGTTSLTFPIHVSMFKDENGNGIGDECEARRSCREILDQQPGAPSGPYTIDPDGTGPQEPLQVHCDMTSHGGGWTNLDFEGGRVLLANGIFVGCTTGLRLSQSDDSIRCDGALFWGDSTKPLYHYYCVGEEPDNGPNSAGYILDHMAPLLGHRSSMVLGFSRMSQSFGELPPSENDQEFCYVNGQVVHYSDPLCQPYSFRGNGNCVPGHFTLSLGL